jgi:beta-ureidopropionase / N-carbamoyl-L-amino-acid hydrolase
LPGTNVIASRVDDWLDLRGDADDSTRSLLAEVLAAAEEAAAEYGCGLEVAEESYVAAVTFDPALRDRLGEALGGPPVLATGAGHDAGALAGELPTAMLFVRNPTRSPCVSTRKPHLALPEPRQCGLVTRRRGAPLVPRRRTE